MSEIQARRPRDLAKWGLFAGLAALCAVSFWLDDRFVFNPRDPEWARISGWWPLAPHILIALAGMLIGPLQFSDTLRRNPGLHRKLGWVYVGAAVIGGPLGALLAFQRHTPALAAAQVAQGSLWALTNLLAFFHARGRNFAAHKLWMMRSYGFAMVFIIGRLPDLQPHFDWDGPPGITVSWTGVVLALILPDLLLDGRRALRRKP